MWSNATGAVSGGGLIAAYCCAGALATVVANTPVSSGKHYVELTLSVRPGSSSPDTWTSAGVTTPDRASPMTPSLAYPLQTSSRSQTSTSMIAWGQWSAYRNGDVFMLAIDADRGLVYHGVNGQWINGVPGGPGGTTIGPRGAKLVPYVNISASSSKSTPEGDRWIANFGGSEYKYPIPEGFGAYATNVPVTTSTHAARSPSPAGPFNATAPQVSASPVNRFFEEEIAIAGQPVPLPPGKWMGLAFFRGSPGRLDGDTVVLARFDNNRVAGMVAINAYTDSINKSGFPAYPPCGRTDYLHIERERNDTFGPQRCWWINHATQPWDEPVFYAARSILEERHISVPEVFVNVAFRRANMTGFTTAFYYSNPEEASIQSQVMEWRSSEWHRDRIKNDPKRVAYVKELETWGKSWAQVFYAMERR